MPDEVTKDVKRAVQDSANLAARAIIPEIPIDDGDLRDSFTVKLGRDKMSASLGYAKRFKRAWRKAGWRAAFTLFGTLGGTIKTGPHKGTVIPPQPPNNFMNRGWQKVSAIVFNKLKTSVDTALKRAANQ